MHPTVCDEEDCLGVCQDILLREKRPDQYIARRTLHWVVKLHNDPLGKTAKCSQERVYAFLGHHCRAEDEAHGEKDHSVFGSINKVQNFLWIQRGR